MVQGCILCRKFSCVYLEIILFVVLIIPLPVELALLWFSFAVFSGIQVSSLFDVFSSSPPFRSPHRFLSLSQLRNLHLQKEDVEKQSENYFSKGVEIT